MNSRDLLLFIAIGDACGAAVEFLNPQKHAAHIRHVRTLSGYLPHPTRPQLTAGQYTDDTQMSIAVAETLLASRAQGRNLSDLTPLDFAEAWTRTFHRDPRVAYANRSADDKGGFQHFLESVKTGEEFLRKINPNSDRNGACMRTVPLGVLSDLSAALDVAKVQAMTTHNTPIGIYSAQIITAMSHFAWHTKEPFTYKLLEFLCDQGFAPRIRTHNFHMGADAAWRDRVMDPATNTVHAVYHLLTRSTTLSDVLRGTIDFGGDTDSVAAIALGIAGPSGRLENDLPNTLFDDLERGPHGYEFLKTLGTNLAETFPSSQT